MDWISTIDLGSLSLKLREVFVSTAYPSSLFEFFALFAALLLTVDNDSTLVAYQINAC